MPRAVRYRILRKIAHGGMAEIFLALQSGAEGFKRPVVLKRILPAFDADPHFVRMLVDEAHIASSLNHSHLVHVLDLGKSGGQFFLVLEFVDGWSLEQVRRRAMKARLKFPLPLAVYIVSSLCRALSYVHQRERDGEPLGIVHRDVSPQNVLLGREGEVKLADFGIAKAVGRREKSATGIIKGKFAYMSPEQSIGGALDARSDLFSVGTLLYILTTGRKPFDAPTDVEVLMQVRRARYEKPTSLNKEFNPDVERFIARALRVDRGRRWQTAEQMADRLDAILVKLGQVSGPAALKRWLDALSARDGERPPGDIVAPDTDVSAGTIELETGDLELGDSASGEIAASPRRAANGGGAAVLSDSSLAPATAVSSAPSMSRPAATRPSLSAAFSSVPPASSLPLSSPLPFHSLPPSSAPPSLSSPAVSSSTSLTSPASPTYLSLAGGAAERASSGSSGSGMVTVPDGSFSKMAAAAAAAGAKTEHDLPTRPVPLYAMLGEPIFSTPEPYADFQTERIEEPTDESPVGEETPFAATPPPAPVAQAVLASAEISPPRAPLPPATAVEVARPFVDDEALPVVQARPAGRKRRPPVVEDDDADLPNYPPVSPVQRALSRIATTIAVLAVLGGGLYVARPFIVPRLPTWPWVVARVVRPVDQWLRHLPMRFVPGLRARSDSSPP
jgi:serine/threonine protein kinase